MESLFVPASWTRYSSFSAWVARSERVHPVMHTTFLQTEPPRIRAVSDSRLPTVEPSTRSLYRGFLPTAWGGRQPAQPEHPTPCDVITTSASLATCHTDACRQVCSRLDDRRAGRAVSWGIERIGE